MALIPWVLALAFVALPSLAGYAAGRLMRSVVGAPNPARACGRAVLVLTPIPLALAVAPRLHQFSIYDLLFCAALFAVLALAGTAHRTPESRKGALVSLATMAVGLGLLELWARSHPVPIDRAEAASMLSYRFGDSERAFQCNSLFPPPAPSLHFGQYSAMDLPERSEGRRRILHLGDSMTAGLDVPSPARFVTLLDVSRGSTEQHLNLGVSSTDTDAQLVIARRWIVRAGGEVVYLHMLPSNDIAGIDNRYPCCDDGPLLAYDTTPPAMRCEEPRWRFTRVWLMQQGPPPYALRVLATVSEVAHQITAALYRNQMRFGFALASLADPSANASSEAARRLHFRAALFGIRDEARRVGVPLVAVVMPAREIVEGTPELTARERVDRELMAARERVDRELMIAALREGGMTFLDAHSLFAEALRSAPGRALFVPGRNNPHFNEAGHRLYADWLAAHIDAR